MEEKSSPRTDEGRFLEALLNACPDAIIAIDAEGKITFVNKLACELTERETHELIGLSITIVYDSLEAARETNRKLYLGGGKISKHASMIKTKKGEIIPVSISACHLKDSSGNDIGAVGYFQSTKTSRI